MAKVSGKVREAASKRAGGSKPQQKKEFDNTNRGALFVNDKGDNDARPDYRGELDVQGTKYRMSAWLNESPKVGQYISVVLSEFEEQE